MDSDAPSKLTMLDFERNIERLVEDFTGREWLFDEIGQWLKRENERFFILTGEPGVGKSAIAARLTHVRAHQIAAYHFCIAGNIGTVTPNTILRSLAAQLAQTLPGYAEALVNTIKPHQVSINVKQRVEKTESGSRVVGVIINHITASNPDEELDILLRAPLALLNTPSEPIFVLIDSLDEASTYAGEIKLVNLLAKVNDLPPWVRFLCTTRPDQLVLSHLQSFEPYTLAAESQMNMSDIGQYIHLRTNKEAIQDQLQVAGVASQDLIDQVTSLSEGNFLYTKMLLNDIETGQQPLDDLSAMPKSLDDIYRSFLRRFSDDDWDQYYQPLLGKLSVAQEPITEERLSRFTGLRPRQVRRSLAVVEQYLDLGEDEAGGKIYRLFHNSLRDFLSDKQRSGIFWCDPKEENELIANHYLESYQDNWHNCDLYGLKHLPFHSAKASKMDALLEILQNFVWLQTKLTAINMDTLITDFDLIPYDSTLQRIKEALLLSSYALEKDKSQLTGQLLGRLLGTKHDGIDTLLKQAKTFREDTNILQPLTASLPWSSGQLYRAMEGHTGAVMDVAAIPNDRRIVSIAKDGTLRVWDAVDRTELLTLEDLECASSNVAVSLDGMWAITSSSGGQICFWNLKVGEASYYEGSLISGGCSRVAFLPDNQHAISRESYQELVIWNVIDQTRVRKISVKLGSRWKIIDFMVMPDGEHLALLAFRGRLGRIYIVNIATGEVIRELKDRVGDGLAVAPDGKNIISATEDREIIVWDIFNNGKVRVIGEKWNFEDIIDVEKFPLAVTPDGEHVLSSGRGMTIKMWHLESGQLVRTFYGHTGAINALAIKSDGQYAISGSDDQTVRIWGLTPRYIDSNLVDSAQHAAKIRAISATPDGQFAITGSDDMAVRVWQFPTDQTSPNLYAQFDGHHCGINGIAVSSDSRILVSVSDEKTIKIWDLDKMKEARSITDYQGKYEGYAVLRFLKQISTGVATVPGSNLFLVDDRDEVLRLADFTTGEVLRSLTGQYKWVRSIAVTPDTNYAIIADNTPWLIIWDLNKKSTEDLFDNNTAPPDNLDWRLFPPPDGYLSVAMSPDGKTLVAGSYDGTLTLWNWESRTLRSRFVGHNQAVTAVAVLPSNRHFVSTSLDANITVWDLYDGSHVATFTDVAAVHACEVSPDGTIIAGGETGYIHFLRLV